MKHRKRWFGVYPGTVVDVSDPKKDGLLRARIDQVYGAPSEDEYIPDASLPWARPCFPMNDAGVPEKGSTVWVTFWAGNPERPVWLGSWSPPQEFVSSYSPDPSTRIIKAGGHKIELRYVDGDVKIRIESRGTIEIVGTGVTVGDGNGAKFRLVDERFIDAFNQHTHTAPSGGGPTSPPVAPITADGNATTITTAD